MNAVVNPNGTPRLCLAAGIGRSGGNAPRLPQGGGACPEYLMRHGPLPSPPSDMRLIG